MAGRSLNRLSQRRSSVESVLRANTLKATFFSSQIRSKYEAMPKCQSAVNLSLESQVRFSTISQLSNSKQTISLNKKFLKMLGKVLCE